MTVSTFARGHKIILTDRGWIYADDHSPYNDSRPCKQCGRYPTKEGFDACLGYIEGVKSACCGHGVEEPYYVPAPTEFTNV